MGEVDKPAPAPEAPKVCGCPGGVIEHLFNCGKPAPAPEPNWYNTTVCFGSDCPNCEREKASPEPKHHSHKVARRHELR